MLIMTLETNIKCASAGDRTRVACVTAYQFIGSMSKMTCTKMQNAKAKSCRTKPNTRPGSSQALSWKSSDLETWIQAIQSVESVFAGGEAC